MADISVEQKRSGGQTWLWALVAVAAVLGLMFWLGAQNARIDAERAAAAAADPENAPRAAATAGGGEAAELAAIAGDPAGFMGRPLSVSAASVAATLGPRAFWADVPGANPFLVVATPEVANTEAIAIGQAMDLTGTVEAVTPEQVDQWVQDGTMQAGARDEATFATHYLRVTQMSPAAAAPAAAPPAQ